MTDSYSCKKINMKTPVCLKDKVETDGETGGHNRLQYLPSNAVGNDISSSIY